MTFQSGAYDRPNGQPLPDTPVVVIAAKGTHDVSRLVNLLNGGDTTVELMELGDQVRRQLNQHARGRTALQLLQLHGGPDLLTKATGRWGELRVRIRTAINDPVSVLPRVEGETVGSWSARAVLALLDADPSWLEAPPVPEGLRATPTVRYQLACSHCGTVHEEEFGPSLWPADALSKLGDYDLQADGWGIDVDGRALVCHTCMQYGYCEGCDGDVYPWTPLHLESSKTSDVPSKWHQGCWEFECAVLVEMELIKKKDALTADVPDAEASREAMSRLWSERFPKRCVVNYRAPDLPAGEPGRLASVVGDVQAQHGEFVVMLSNGGNEHGYARVDEITRT